MSEARKDGCPSSRREREFALPSPFFLPWPSMDWLMPTVMREEPCILCSVKCSSLPETALQIGNTLLPLTWAPPSPVTSSPADEKVPFWGVELPEGDSSHFFLHWLTCSCNTSTSLQLNGSCLRTGEPACSPSPPPSSLKPMISSMLIHHPGSSCTTGLIVMQ